MWIERDLMRENVQGSKAVEERKEEESDRKEEKSGVS